MLDWPIAIILDKPDFGVSNAKFASNTTPFPLVTSNFNTSDGSIDFTGWELLSWNPIEVSASLFFINLISNALPISSADLNASIIVVVLINNSRIGILLFSLSSSVSFQSFLFSSVKAVGLYLFDVSFTPQVSG